MQQVSFNMIDNEIKAGEAFSKQSFVFDKLNAENKVSQYMRTIFRQEVSAHAKPQSIILELNCGTGLDAIYFAEHGHFVLATDISQGMLQQLDKKISEQNLHGKIITQHSSFHDIDKIQNKKFDHIISNFGGLNCTNDLQDVLLKFSPLLQDGGKITLMIMPKICLWEIAALLKGNFKTAFRRFKNGTPANVEGIQFLCYYYNPSYVIKTLKKEFEVLSLRGVCIFAPPEAHKHFAERFPKLFSFLCKVDKAIGKKFPFTYCCDHYVITLKKKL